MCVCVCVCNAARNFSTPKNARTPHWSFHAGRPFVQAGHVQADSFRKEGMCTRCGNPACSFFGCRCAKNVRILLHVSSPCALQRGKSLMWLRQVKEVLSANDETSLSIEGLYQDKNLRATVTRKARGRAACHVRVCHVLHEGSTCRASTPSAPTSPRVSRRPWTPRSRMRGWPLPTSTPLSSLVRCVRACIEHVVSRWRGGCLRCWRLRLTAHACRWRVAHARCAGGAGLLLRWGRKAGCAPQWRRGDGTR